MTTAPNHSITSKRIAAAALALAGVGVGAWWLSRDAVDRRAERLTEAPPAPLASELPVVLPPPSDPIVSTLGTDSSASGVPITLRLIATYPGASPRQGTAALGVDERNPQVFRAGAHLASGAVLEEIHARHVVLFHNGKRSTLSLNESPQADALAALTMGGAEVIEQPLEEKPSSRPDYSDVIRPSMVFENEKFAGLELKPGGRSHLFARLGLESGDIVRSIDGRLIASDAAWQKIHAALASDKSLLLGIERQGALIAVPISGSKLNDNDIHAAGAGYAPPPAL